MFNEHLNGEGATCKSVASVHAPEIVPTLVVQLSNLVSGGAWLADTFGDHHMFMST